MKKGDQPDSAAEHPNSRSTLRTGTLQADVETFLIDKAGILTVSEGFDLGRFGLKPSRASGLSVFDQFRDEPILLNAVNQALRGEPSTIEATQGGLTFATHFSPVRDSEGKINSIIGISNNITESKKAGETIRKNEFRLRTLFNSAHDAIFTLDNKVFVDCNEATLRIFQCEKNQIVGQTPYRFSPLKQPNGRLSEEAALEKINAALSGKPQSFEWRHIRFDGTPFDAEVSLNRLDLEGEVQIQAIVRDVDERKRAEEENRRLAMVANTTTNMVVLADGEGRIEWVNPAFTRITGYQLDEVKGKKPGSFLKGKETDPQASLFMKEKLANGQGFKDVEVLNYSKEGKLYWVSIEVQPILDSTGKAVQFIAIESDITERKANQQALIDRNEDLSKINAELDRFVYSASHDLRAPISSLLGLIGVARLEKDMGNLETLFDLQEKSLLRLDRFIKDIVDHSRNTRLQVESESVNFESMVNATFEQLQFMDNVHHIRSSIFVEQKGLFFTASTRVDIVLSNLISNAVKYADLRKEDPYLEVRITSDDKGAELRVTDNGEGIPTDAKPKIFDMFYRASANGSGSGLGLYIVKEAVEKLGGTISVHSEYGKGTEFVVSIPNLSP